MKDKSTELSALTEQLASGSEEALAELDKHGLFAAPGEDAAQCAARIKRWLEANDTLHREIKSGRTAEIDAGIKVSKRDIIPPEYSENAEKRTTELYGFSADWVPSFFLDSGVGLLWGGCAWHDEATDRTLFALRGTFRKKDKYLVYGRDELIAHESCHAARSVFGDDWQLEEFFAYRTSKHSFRRYMGNCFVLKSDAFLFLAPAIFLLVQQMLRIYLFPALPWWPAWLLLAATTSYLLGRNQYARNKYSKAEKNFIRFASVTAVQAGAILFRCTWQEIKKAAACRSKEEFLDYLRSKNANDLRFRTALRRFVPEYKEVVNEE